jgi:Abortive infection C-terminus
MSADWYPGIKAFCEHWRHAPMLQQTFATLEREFADENDACIDAAKGLVESACQVLIREIDNPLNPIRKWPDSPLRDSHPSFKNWVVAAVRLLALSEGRDDPFNKVISHHFTLTEALGKFRDIAGTVSHGKDGLISKLSAHHRRGALLAADAIVSFLHQAYLEREPDPVRTFEPNERFEASNAIIDEFATLRVELDEEGFIRAVVVLPDGQEVPLAIETSRLLFGVDREAYKLVLDSCREAKAAVPQDGEVV